MTSHEIEKKRVRYLHVGVSDRGILNRLVNLFCVLPIPDGDAKRHKVYTGSGNRGPVQAIEALRPVREIDLVFLAPECL